MLEKSYLEELIEEGLSHSGLSNKTGLSKGTIRYWLDKHGLETKHINNHANGNERTCLGCDSKYYYVKGKNNTLSRCVTCTARKYRVGLKNKIVEYLGGECVRCGYKKSNRALHAHHKNPKDKSFGISGSHTRSWKAIESELEKCELLCSNCHAETHEELDIK